MDAGSTEYNSLFFFYSLRIKQLAPTRMDKTSFEQLARFW